MFNKKPEFKTEKKVQEEMKEQFKEVITPKKEVNIPKTEIKAGNPDEKVINGKLFKSVGYMENGCSKSKLEEVK